MREDRKIIEQNGVKYCKEGGQWYQMFPIKEDKVFGTKKPTKINLLPEIQLDIFKCLDFTQLLVVQQANIYFKNFIYEHRKVLAMKEFGDLEMFPITEEDINGYKQYGPYLKLYDFELEQYRFCDFGMCEQKYKFFKPEPRLYEFELGEELEKKWKDGIEKKVPMFLTSLLTPNVNTVVFELERNYETEKALYYFQLSKYPKNIEEMKIARYFFQLLFNCSFHVFKIRHVIINQQMIELLFDNEIARNVPLQIHSQGTFLHTYERFFVEFMWNHLVTNHFFIVFNETFDLEQNMDIIFKILTCGGDKFIEVSFEYLNSNLYNIIIEHIETSQNISTMVNGIKFNKMYGPLNSSKRAQNVEVKVGCDMEFTRFKLFNKHNPKIVFSIGIIDGYYDEEDDDYVSPDFGDSSPKIVVIDKDCHRFMELVP